MFDLDMSMLDALIKRCKDERVSITLRIQPENQEIEIEPWESYHPTCPYGQAPQRLNSEELIEITKGLTELMKLVQEVKDDDE